MWPLIRKDIIRKWRAPVPTLTMLLFPLFMAGVMGSLFGGGGSEFPIIDVLVQNNDDGGILGETITSMLGQEEGAEYFRLTLVGDEGREMMEKGKASALVIFPENFTDDVFDGVPTAIEIVRNPAEGIKPEIVEQGVEALTVYLDQLARLLGDEFTALQGMLEADQMPAVAQVGALAGAVMTKVTDSERYLFPPIVKLGSTKLDEDDEDAGPDFNIFGYLLVMTSVMSLLFVAARSVYDLFEEEKSGMLRRQMSTPIGVSRIVAAKILAGVVFGVVVLFILAVIGLALGWIEPPVDFVGALLLTIAFSLSACGVLAVIFSFVTNEKQAGILSWLLIMGMSALGGSMIPVEQMPEAMKAFSKFTTNYWAIEGYKELLFAKASTADISKNLLILFGSGVVTLLLAQQLLTRKFKEIRG